jgi:superfamily II DNA or RNA helicase
MSSSQYFYSNQLSAYIRRAGPAYSRYLVQENRIQNPVVLKQKASAIVYDSRLIDPVQTQIHWDRDGFFTTCSCGSETPCAHSAGLLMYLSSHDSLPETWDMTPTKILTSKIVPEDLPGHPGTQDHQPSSVLSGSHAKQRSLEPPPGQLELFSTDTLEPESSINPSLGSESSVPPENNLSLVFQIQPQPGGLVLVPKCMGKNPEETGMYPYNEAFLPPSLPEPLELLLDMDVKTKALGSQLSILMVFDQWDTIHGNQDHYSRFRIPLHWQNNSIPVKLVKVSQVTLGFARIADTEDQLQFRPQITWTFQAGVRPLTTGAEFNYWEQDNRWYWYQQDRNWIITTPQWQQQLSVLSTLFSPHEQGFTREEILALGNRIEGLPGIRFEFGSEDERILMPKPKLVVAAQGHGQETELYLSFHYRGWEPEYQSRILEQPIIRAGKEMVIRRSLDAEAALVHELVQILGERVVYERGYYAQEIRGFREADVKIALPLNEFLHGCAESIMKQAIEIRIENRKVRFARDIHFSLERNMDWFGVQAHVELDDQSDGLPGSKLADGWGVTSPSLSSPMNSDDPEHEPFVSQWSNSDSSSIVIDDQLHNLGVIRRGADFVVLREKDLRRLEYLRRQGMTESGSLVSSAANLVLIDAVYHQTLAEEEQLQDLDQRREALEKLKNPDLIPQVTPPRKLNAQLRPYQSRGLDWLVFMHGHGLHPCLADDMGLGKTLQTLSLLVYLQERGGLQSPVLLVTPVVTLGNWEAEAQRFAPSLRVTRHSGSDRSSEPLDFSTMDLLLVSYHTLRNDLELFLDHEFTYLILDEAHSIKNHYSQVFKAVRSLKSRHRLSLTGTPIENTLMELWSQMNFLNPGLLGTAKEFYNRFFVPIERQGDQQILEELKELVSPLILRRTKEEVLDELPSKEVIVQYCEMGDYQAEEYRRQRDMFRDQILGLVQSKIGGIGSVQSTGSAGSKQKSQGIEVFRFLLKLRQLAIHPPLAGPEFHQVPSAKVEALMLLLNDIMKENHKVLIFSQFLGTLDVISQECEKRQWKTLLLTGASQDRSEIIRSFQTDPKYKIFLLSLKAGGVGVNLTAADYVILFDPWWNPAAEKQAIDRAHRMGQKNKVIAYKLIVRGTIEEKILQLQEKKHALAEEIVTEKSGILASLGAEGVVDLFQ